MKLIIFGASGSGMTTLAKSLAEKLNWTHLDADEYYWEKTQPPFQFKRPLEERNHHLKNDFTKVDNVIISGSLVTWGKYWNTAFDLAFFLRLAPKIRMERLKKREWERYGLALENDQAIMEKSKAFLQWAERYDDETFEGRSIRQHKKWIELLSCKVVEINGEITNEEREAIALKAIK